MDDSKIIKQVTRFLTDTCASLAGDSWEFSANFEDGPCFIQTINDETDIEETSSACFQSLFAESNRVGGVVLFKLVARVAGSKHREVSLSIDSKKPRQDGGSPSNDALFRLIGSLAAQNQQLTTHNMSAIDPIANSYQKLVEQLTARITFLENKLSEVHEFWYNEKRLDAEQARIAHNDDRKFAIMEKAASKLADYGPILGAAVLNKVTPGGGASLLAGKFFSSLTPDQVGHLASLFPQIAEGGFSEEQLALLQSVIASYLQNKTEEKGDLWRAVRTAQKV